MCGACDEAVRNAHQPSKLLWLLHGFGKVSPFLVARSKRIGLLFHRLADSHVDPSSDGPCEC